MKIEMRICRIIFVLFYLFLANVYVLSNQVSTANRKKEIGVTNIVMLNKGSQRRARVILAGLLVIENIVVNEDGTIMLPHYVSKYGIFYPQIEILDIDIRNAFLDSIKSYKETSSKEYKMLKFEVRDVRLTQNPDSKRVCNADVIFEGAIRVACGLMKTRKGYMVAWPATKDEKGIYRNEVYLLNRGFKKVVESSILRDFYKLKQSR